MTAKQNITALIYNKKGKLLSIGKNSYIRTHPFQARCAAKVGEPEKIYIHAEIDALVKLKDWSKAYKLVITRVLKDGSLALAKPCKSCQLAISLTNIKRIEHS